MAPTESWIDDWQIDVSPPMEVARSRELLLIFQQFWQWAGLNEKSKSAQRKYHAGLHALGGWSVEKLLDGTAAPNVQQLLLEATQAGEEPLIFPDNEVWQGELDTVCRKLHKFLRS